MRGLTAEVPELRPELLDAATLAREEPSLAPGLSACRLETAWPVAPGAATRAFAELARRRGVRFRVGEAPGPGLDPGATLLAAGPWTPELAPACRSRRSGAPWPRSSWSARRVTWWRRRASSRSRRAATAACCSAW